MMLDTFDYCLLDELIGTKLTFCPNAGIYDEHHSWWEVDGMKITVVDTDETDYIQLYIDKDGIEIKLEIATFKRLLTAINIFLQGNLQVKELDDEKE